LLELNPEEIRVFSRDEKKQSDMRYEFAGCQNVSFVIGDVRDRNSVQSAMRDVDVVFHAAALKQVPNCEFNPFQAVLTNVIGAQTVIDCALEANVERLISISTDKAVEPVNVMGMTKAIQERLVISAGFSCGRKRTICSCVRYGNVLGSRGSVVPLFSDYIEKHLPIPITGRRMTRFILTLSEAVDLMFHAVCDTSGGEVFVRKSPAHRVIDLAEVMIEAAGYNLTDYPISEIGIRPGEKIHETLISPMESLRVLEADQYFTILPQIGKGIDMCNPGAYESFRFSSDRARILNKTELASILRSEGWIT